MSLNLKPIRRLNRNEFAVALQKGHGRAHLHVLQYGLDGVADLVLDACIRNKVYDQDVEPGRGDWLFSMFRDTPHYSLFRAEILAALKIETDMLNLFQLIQIAGNFARTGDTDARTIMGEAVYRIAANPESNDWIGVEDWLDLVGAKGMLKLAKIYGQRLQRNPEDIVNPYLLNYPGHPDFPEILEQNASTDLDIKRYQKYLEQHESQLAIGKSVDKASRDQQTRERIRTKYTLQNIFEAAREKRGSYPSRYMTFGKHATQIELNEIYQALIQEPDASVRTRLLWVFRRTKLPRLDEPLFQWAYSKNDDLKSATIAALAQISDQQVHDLARKKVERGELTGGDREVFDLFLKNYTTDDAQWINQGLKQIQPDQGDAHSLSYSILELANLHKDESLTPSVLWAYENTPCGYCRLKAVKWLAGQNQLSDEMRFECQYDANEDIRSSRRNIL